VVIKEFDCAYMMAHPFRCVICSISDLLVNKLILYFDRCKLSGRYSLRSHLGLL